MKRFYSRLNCGMFKAIIKVLCIIGVILTIMHHFIVKEEQRNCMDIMEKNKSRTIIELEEDKYADYSFCSDKKVNDYKEWRSHFITSESSNTSVKNYLPTKVEDAPIGLPATIPTAFLIEENDFCTKRPFLKAIVYVHTAINNTERRALTRATWGRASDKVGVLYFVGKAKSKDEEDIISSESLIHRDIVQGNYTDLYQFLVYKNLNALHWIMKNCNQIKWVVHADDDVLFDVRKFLNFADSDIIGNHTRQIYCNLKCDSAVGRGEGSKWTITKEMYPYEYYPIYCQGYLWFTSINTVRRFLEMIPLVKYVWVEDAFLTGLVAERAEVQRYQSNISLGFQLEDVGTYYGWLNNDGIKMIEFWNNIVSYYRYLS